MLHKYMLYFKSAENLRITFFIQVSLATTRCIPCLIVGFSRYVNSANYANGIDSSNLSP